MNCELTFLPVGNADSMIVSCPNSIIIIDLGNPRLLDKWLLKQKVTEINRVYITHAHGDHCPALVKLVKFLKDWFKRGTIEIIYLPYLMYQVAQKRILAERKTNSINKKIEELELALNQLNEWDKNNTVNFLPIARGANTYSSQNLAIDILHPRQLFIESNLASSYSKLNEISLVLRISYGKFISLLLADIEDEGLKECLDICTEDELKANIVKIPHHGAYPKNSEALKQLLEKIDAEIAILSVGSTNPYGHVIPELFSLLLNLQNDGSKRLYKFICTEVTRTCVYSRSERLAMKKSGLNEQQKCAGEIRIVAEASGQWNLITETNHEDIISRLQYPACRRKADLGDN